MQITEKQKQQLIDLNDSRVNEILNLIPKINNWYKHIDTKFMIYLTKFKNEHNCEGFFFDGIHGEYRGFSNTLGLRYCVSATKKEIEEALTDEAKRRGFKKGVRVKLFDSIFSTSILKREDFTYQEDYNRFGIRGGDEDGSYAVLFKDGEWAEIIDEKSGLKQEIKELEVKLKELREKL